MNAREMLLAEFHRLAEVPDAVPRLRRFVLDLAVRGRLVPQRADEGVGADVLAAIDSDLEERQQAGLFREPRKAIALAPEDLPLTTPTSWAWVHLVKIAEVSYGFPFDSNLFNATRTGRPLIRIRDIRRTDTEAYTDEPCDDYYLVRPGDYLVGMDGDFNVAAWAGPVALLNQRVARFRNWSRRVEPRFLALPLQVVLDHLHGQTSQTTVKHLSAKQIGGVILPLPPLAEQRRIVAKVDELMALCDRLEAAQQDRVVRGDRLAASGLASLCGVRVRAAPTADRFVIGTLPRVLSDLERLKDVRAVISDLAVQGRLVPQHASDDAPRLAVDLCDRSDEGYPPSWRCTALANLLSEDSRNGYSRKPDDVRDGVPILRISAGTVRLDGIVAEEEHKRIGGISEECREQYGLRRGDLLACRFNGNRDFVGRLSLFTDYLKLRPIYPDKLIRLRVNQAHVLPQFVLLAGNSPLVRREIETLCATTVGNWGISASNLKTVRLPVPPLAEQRRILAKVEEIMIICDRLAEQILSGQRQAARLLESVLRASLEEAA